MSISSSRPWPSPIEAAGSRSRRLQGLPGSGSHVRLNRDEAERYVAADRPLDCAGSYKIESLGIALFDRIEAGDQTAIVGLPLLAVCRMLRARGHAHQAQRRAFLGSAVAPSSTLPDVIDPLSDRTGWDVVTKGNDRARQGRGRVRTLIAPGILWAPPPADRRPYAGAIRRPLDSEASAVPFGPAGSSGVPGAERERGRRDIVPPSTRRISIPSVGRGRRRGRPPPPRSDPP